MTKFISINYMFFPLCKCVSLTLKLPVNWGYFTTGETTFKIRVVKNGNNEYQ